MRSHTFTTFWWQPVLAVTLLSFTVTAALFTVGINRLTQEDTTKNNKNCTTVEADGESAEQPSPFNDATFVIFLSQIIPNFLTIFYEVSKLSYETPMNVNMKSHLYFYVVMVLAATFSLAAPIVYGTGDRENGMTKANAAILNFCATLIIIFAGLLGVFEVGIQKNGSMSAKKTWRLWKCW
jgi:hypothetical protein